MISEEVVRRLREALSRVRITSARDQSTVASLIIGAKTEVIGKYGAMFSPEAIHGLTQEGFKSFLVFKNNHHWKAIQRHGGELTADMDRLRNTLGSLLDETVPIRTRLDKVQLKGLGRAVITPILHVVYPDRYGVLNKKAEAGMKALGLWPDFPKGASFGEQYEIVNRIIVETARAAGVDLWTLDTLWWCITESPREPTEPPSSPVEGLFGLERYLHEFLVDHWDQLSIAQDWELLEEGGETVGSRYDTEEVGEIDLLAKHKRENRWLVIELKRSQSSDATVGQILRYMAWVRLRLAKDAKVSGLVICGDVDKKLQFALDGQPDVKCMTYQLTFNLGPAPQLL